MPWSRVPVLLLRFVEEELRLFRQRRRRLHYFLVTFVVVLIAKAVEHAFGLDALAGWFAFLAVAAFVAFGHWALEPLAVRTFDLLCERVVPELSMAASELAKLETRISWLVLSGALAFAALFPELPVLCRLSMSGTFVGAWLVLFLVARRGRIDVAESSAVLEVHDSAAWRRARFVARSRDGRRRVRWTFTRRPAGAEDLPLVTMMAKMAFGVTGPNSRGLRRSAYMESLWRANPEVFWIIEVDVQQAVQAGGDEPGVGDWRPVQRGPIGYLSVVPLRAEACAQYVGAAEQPNTLSQFEFARADAVVAPPSHGSGPNAECVCIQAMVDLGHYRWHTHRVPRASEFMAQSLLVILDGYRRGGDPLSVVAEATTAEGLQVITRYLRFLRSVRQDARTLRIRKSIEGHDLFRGTFSGAAQES